MKLCFLHNFKPFLTINSLQKIYKNKKTCSCKGFCDRFATARRGSIIPKLYALYNTLSSTNFMWIFLISHTICIIILFFYYATWNATQNKKSTVNTVLLKQGMRDSNPHRRFWRPVLYHWTNPLYSFFNTFP